MIHTSRTVTVGKMESVINEPIMLYRGDREVEIEFNIVGSKFMFSNGGNVIKSTNATNGQLVINTPTGENMFSEVTECNDGKVVCVITKEMIDELAEVGFYSFQIRLFDESQVSRVTIPPVYQGIEIRNPIAAEDETDLVDIGLVDFSVVRKDNYENVVTFLPNGDYNKTLWEEHDVISKDRLNKVEDALYEINKGTEGLYPTFQNQYDEFSAKVDKDVKAYKEEMEDEVEQFERDMTQAFGEFKVDYKDDMYDRMDVVEADLEEANLQLARIDKKEFVSIMDYGAIGDKNNDDTQAIINALSKGRYVTAKGEKHYIISGVITIPKHVTLDFNNAYVTFMGNNACFKLKQSSSLKNVRINIPAGLVLSKSVIYIDGNDVFHVGYSTTPNIENISIDQAVSSSEDIAYRKNIGIWLDASQNKINTSCCISGVLFQNIKATLLKHVIYLSAKDQPGNTSFVYITSNTFKNILAYNCACFIKDEVIEGSTEKAMVSSNVYENLHFQPADDIETCYIDICGEGNSFLNPIFWDNSRPSNVTNQIIIRGNHNHISGPKIPPYKSSYVNIIGEYNFYHGNTYGMPTQYYGGKYISGRGYQKEWKNKLLPMEYIYSKAITSIKSGTIEGSNDTITIEMPLTFGELGEGYTNIKLYSVGTCDKTTEVRRFWAGLGDNNYFVGASSQELYAESYECEVNYSIRKYAEKYAKVVVSTVYCIGGTRIIKIRNETIYDITDETVINPRLLIGSTSKGNIEQLYYDIKISFHE